MRSPLPGALHQLVSRTLALAAPLASAQLWETCTPLATHTGSGQVGAQFGWIGVRAEDVDGVTDFLLTGATHGNSEGDAYVVSSLDPQPPTSYCTATPNFAGTGARMAYRQSTSLAANEFRLRVEQAPAGVQGVFL